MIADGVLDVRPGSPDLKQTPDRRIAVDEFHANHKQSVRSPAFLAAGFPCSQTACPYLKPIGAPTWPVTTPLSWRIQLARSATRQPTAAKQVVISKLTQAARPAFP
jgi:hypothetical protein